jgi:hypothetical protein
MKGKVALPLVLVGLVSLWPAMTALDAQPQQQPAVQMPQPGVPEIFTLEGKFVRAAYNNEGYVILGYQATNYSVGDEWMLLEVGMTVMDGVKDYTLTRDKLSLEMPDGTTIPLPTIAEHRGGDTRPIENRAGVQRDSINYFPPRAAYACRIGFFADLSSRARAYDQVELSSSRACLGRVFFRIPGGIVHGQYWLDVKFEQSLVRVPFRVLTDEEEKLLSKNYKDIKKQVEDAFKKKGL